MNVYNTKPFDSVVNFIEKHYRVFLFTILIASSFNLFFNLGKVPIYSWDEARHGVNAYEMIKRNNFLVSTYAYKNDYWNLKPPLSHWAIILGYKIFGFNPLGLRIFSALASLVTIFIISQFALYHHGRIASLISAAVLTTTVPFVLEHCARTGDADSLFVLFFTLSMLTLSLIEQSNSWLYLSGLFFSLAFLTKSWHSISIMSIIGLYLFFTGTLFKLKTKDITQFILFSVLPIIIWILFRYRQDGLTFVKNMIDYDLIARTAQPLEGHNGNIFYYFDVLQNSNFYWTSIFIGTLLASTLFINLNEISRRSKNHIILLLLWILVPFLLFTKAKTKISWYLLPLYPAMAISIGAAISSMLKSKSRNLILQLLLSFVLIFTVYKEQTTIAEKILSPVEDPAQDLIKGMENLPEYRGKQIYIHHFEQSYWLSAEFYGDLIPVEGGIDGFIKDESRSILLFITKDRQELNSLDLSNFKIVSENEVAYIFTK